MLALRLFTTLLLISAVGAALSIGTLYGAVETVAADQAYPGIVQAAEQELYGDNAVCIKVGPNVWFVPKPNEEISPR